MKRWTKCLWGTALLLGLPLSAAWSDQPSSDSEPRDNKQQPATKEDSVASEQAERFRKFEETLSGARLVGHFTVAGKPTDKLNKEEYFIASVKKLPSGDLWLFTARVKYGNHDLTVPMPLEVKWAHKTPVITLDEITIPGLGTFSARVVIDSGKYAGTWTHGPAGGHLFGTIEKGEAPAAGKAEEGAAPKKTPNQSGDAARKS